MRTLWGDPGCFTYHYANFLYMIAAKIAMSYITSLLCKVDKKFNLHFVSLS